MLTVVLLVVAAVIAVAPVAQVPGPRIPGFVLAQQSVQLTSDLIIAVLLFGQYSIVRGRGLNILAGGYLFTALIVIPHALTFPELFTSIRLPGGGTQSAAWLYVVWHTGLPLTVTIYALTHNYREQHQQPRPNPRGGILFAVVAAVGAVITFGALAAFGDDWLPVLVAGDKFTAAARAAVGIVLGVTIGALFALSRQRPATVLNSWLTLVMVGWVASVTVGSFISGGRFDVGWYAGRAFSMLASLTVLILLISETIALYRQIVHTTAAERRERERRLREVEAVLIHLGRVSELSTIVSSLIHEVNQPLSAISNYVGAGIRLAATETDGRLKSLFEKCEEQAARATGIIRHLRDFVSKRETVRRLDDVPSMLRDALRLALAGAPAGALAIDVRCAPGASAALFDRIQIEQVVFNLVRNAVEAMAGSARKTLTLTASLTDDEMVEISVADTGPGLSPEVRAKLFEPFVTSKDTGLGVGLSICRFIIEAHGGLLSAENRPGGGAVFRFTLPIEADETERVSEAIETSRASPRISLNTAA